MDQILYYLSTLVVFFFIYNILTWGLNIQFGYGGILDFTYITFFAAGAYLAGVGSLGKPTAESQQLYVLGLGWGFLPALLLGAVVAGLLGLLVGLVALYRLRSDFLAIVTVGIGTIAFDLVSNYRPLFNGQDGISGVSFPFNDILNLDPNTYTFFYIGFSGVVMLILWWVAHRIDVSPLGRTLRAIRDDVDVAEAFGKNTYKFRMIAMVIGCVYAGIGGGLLIGFISSLNPGGWTTGETFVVWAALLLGGRGNNLGAVLGALVVPVIFTEATRFLPPISANPALVPALRNVIVGALLIVVLFFRPQGILPERRRLFFELPASR
ncbi:MAG: branched-chain amino acid ABC transporter permease, partial [Candidatus Dormiibacterota bacterium]